MCGNEVLRAREAGLAVNASQEKKKEEEEEEEDVLETRNTTTSLQLHKSPAGRSAVAPSDTIHACLQNIFRLKRTKNIFGAVLIH